MRTRAAHERTVTRALDSRPTSVAPDSPGPSAGHRHAEAERLAVVLARWYVEALAGRRDTRPLRDLLTPAVAQRVRCAVLREAVRRHAGLASQSAVVTVRRCVVQPLGQRYESTTIVDDGHRATAVAATLHARGAGWLVSELARPEDNLPPLRTPWMRPIGI